MKFAKNAMNKLSVLTYHAIDTRPSVISIDPRLFQSQMEMLAAQNFIGIGLSEAFDHLERTGSFPENSIVLTFDDGYTSLLEEVLPITQALGFSATAFVIYDLIGLNAEQARSVVGDINRDMLGWSQIEELISSGFEIGSHTRRHPDLTRLSAVALGQELGDAKERLQQHLQVPVDALAYPYGHLNRAVKNAASGHYKLACTTRLGRVTRDMDPLQLKRIDAYYLRNPKTFLSVCNGGFDAYLHFRQHLRDLKQRLTRS